VTVFLTTLAGDLVALRRDGDGTWTAETVLSDTSAECVATDGTRVLVGTRENGARLSRDDGRTWDRVDLPEQGVFAVAIGAADGALYAGTEPSRLFVSDDGDAWTELEALQDIPSKPSWSFPPRPWTHRVRWIAPDPHDARRLLVGIELGGLMRTDDGGATFEDHRPGAGRDTHQLAWHPTAPGRAYQAAGDAAARSHDGGATWERLDQGRADRYCWALALDPEDADRWYLSATTGPGAAHAAERARGHLYRTDGDGWRRLTLPDEAMPYALATTAGGSLLVATADGRLFESRDRGERFANSGVRLGPILAMAASG
jgi:hypothetical protein